MNRAIKQKADVKIIPRAAKIVAADQMPGAGKIAERMKEIIELLGEDTNREGLIKTPGRYEKAMRYLMSGYEQRLEDIVNGALFSVECDEMVIVKNIEFFSMCEHHMLPFFGKVHIAYLPKDKVIGLSKLPRIVDMFARRMQLQERMTHQIAEAVAQVVSPRGVGVLSEAQHFCMMMRGVEKQHSGAVTSTMLGAFRKQIATRDEFLSLVR